MSKQRRGCSTPEPLFQGECDVNTCRARRKALVLEERHMISTLLYLAKSGGCTKSELYRAVSTNPRMPEKLDLLESAGLITQTPSVDSRAVRICLTEAGAQVALALDRIDSLLPDQDLNQ